MVNTELHFISFLIQSFNKIMEQFSSKFHAFKIEVL